MTDRPAPPRPACVSQEQWEKISGGDCGSADLVSIGGDLRQQYNALVDFTSYVIERLANS